MFTIICVTNGKQNWKPITTFSPLGPVIFQKCNLDKCVYVQKKLFITALEKTTKVKIYCLHKLLQLDENYWILLNSEYIIDVMSTFEHFSDKYGILYLLSTFASKILQVFRGSTTTLLLSVI